MLIIPTEGNISWKNPPWVTILLILINCFVFFGFQSGEDQKTIEVFLDYFKSGLAEIEIPRYIDFLQTNRENIDEIKEFRNTDIDSRNPVAVSILMSLENDSDFLNALYKDEIVQPVDLDFRVWKFLRNQFDDQKNTLVTYKYGLIPAKFRPYTFITAMFLHGSAMHLIGNMIFLWIVGCLLEMGCGRMVYGIGYLMVGLCASLFFSVVHHNSYVPMIGASGAISGLMGALTVLYGKSRIKVFLTTGFYFDTFKMPAIILLPFWVGNEFFQFYFGGNEQVAYMAHAGGLIGGAALGVASKFFFNKTQTEYFREKPQDKTPALMEEVISRIARLDFAGARPIVTELLEENPEHKEALEHLFTIDKQHPDNPEFETTAARFLAGLVKSKSDADKTWKVYAEHLRISKKPDLPVDLQVRLFSLFCENGHLEEAERIMTFLLSNKPDHPNIPIALLRVVQGFEKNGGKHQANHYRQMLLEKYPMSREARLAGGTPAK